MGCGNHCSYYFAPSLYREGLRLVGLTDEGSRPRPKDYHGGGDGRRVQSKIPVVCP